MRDISLPVSYNILHYIDYIDTLSHLHIVTRKVNMLSIISAKINFVIIQYESICKTSIGITLHMSG